MADPCAAATTQLSPPIRRNGQALIVYPMLYAAVGDIVMSNLCVLQTDMDLPKHATTVFV